MMCTKTLLRLDGTSAQVGSEALCDIQRALYKEARLLDEERLDEWLEMLHDDLVYWMPNRENFTRRFTAIDIDPRRVALFEETKNSMIMRIKRNQSGLCWTEDPPTRHVYSISNIEGFVTDMENCFEVHSIGCLYRNRSERDSSTLFVRRKDLWKANSAAGMQLLARLVLLQQSTLRAKNLSVFF